VAVQVIGEDGSVAETGYACRYRGIENPFGHLEECIDGVLLVGRGDIAAWYCADKPSMYSSTQIDGYSFRGNVTPATSFVKDIVFGEHGDILCSETGAGSTTYFCDQAELVVTDGEVRCMTVGGASHMKYNAGFLYERAKFGDAQGNAYGTRLCFIPKNE
jgi:hypothetical protein